MSVLIVDDEPMIRRTLVQFLEMLDVHADTAANGKEALAMAESKDYDAIITDLEMPGGSGLELAKALRDRQKTLPIWAFTGSYCESGDSRFAVFDAIFEKPMDYSRMIATVLKSMGRPEIKTPPIF